MTRVMIGVHAAEGDPIGRAIITDEEPPGITIELLDRRVTVEDIIDKVQKGFVHGLILRYAVEPAVEAPCEPG